MQIKTLAVSVATALAALAMSAQAQIITKTVAGHNGPVTVQVNVQNGAVKSVKITKSSETPGIGTVAAEKIPQAIVDAGSTDVPVVTGASVTSNAIKQAVNSALKEAKGQKIAKAQFKPGTYKASSYGSNGYIDVAVTVSKDRIEDIKVLNSRETPFMGEMAIPELRKEIIGYQTLNVDSISGATVTSAAFKKAVTEALEQSGVDFASLQKPVPLPEKLKPFVGVRTVSSDLVIVGSGGAGLSAAVTAAEAGKKVVVLEKMPVIGGNTLRCASAFNAADPDRQVHLNMTDQLKKRVVAAISEKPVSEEHAKLQADVKAKYDAYLASGSKALFDCPEWHALQTYNGGDKVGHIPLIRTYAENVLDTLHWMQGLGTPVLDNVSQGAGALWQRTHQVELGRIYKADTLEGLEKQLGMPAGNLVKTVAEFNKMVEAKADPKFGRTLFHNKIMKAPFYATPRAPSIHHTMGGLYINSNAQVINTKGQVIPGLYAAGEVAGGIHGSNRLGGNATADVLTFGRIAAKSALGL